VCFCHTFPLKNRQKATKHGQIRLGSKKKDKRLQADEEIKNKEKCEKNGICLHMSFFFCNFAAFLEKEKETWKMKG